MQTNVSSMMSDANGGTLTGRRRAFTLVELLVVIGIIGLLVSMALPAFKAARDAARVASTQATIGVMSTGLEQYHSDSSVGGDYPPSLLNTPASPHGSGLSQSDRVVGGTNLVAWALVGADLLGSPGFHDIDNVPDPWEGWDSDTGNGPGLYTLDAGKPVHPRVGPYVDISKVKFAELNRQIGPTEFVVPAGTGNVMRSICFLDGFGQPILYYRANVGQTYMATDSKVAFYEPINGIYNLDDNRRVTGPPNGFYGYEMDFGAGTDHFKLQTPESEGGAEGTVGNWSILGSFEHTIWNPAVTAVDRPHNMDSYILLAAGPDGLYGTADDVANFPINK